MLYTDLYYNLCNFKLLKISPTLLFSWLYFFKEQNFKLNFINVFLDTIYFDNFIIRVIIQLDNFESN